MKQKNKHTINNKDGFKVPKNYFDSVEDTIFERLSDENLLDNTNLKIPKNYFDSVEDTVFKKLNLKKETKTINIKRILIITSVAASLLFLFSLLFFNVEKNNTNTFAIYDVENWLDDNIESLDMYNLVENLDVDKIETLQNYKVSEILTELEGIDIELITDEFDAEF